MSSNSICKYLVEMICGLDYFLPQGGFIYIIIVIIIISIVIIITLAQYLREIAFQDYLNIIFGFNTTRG